MKTTLLIFFTYGLMLVQSTHVFANATEHKTRVIHSNEKDEGLKHNKNASLNLVLSEYMAKGGTIIRLDKDALPFALLPGDMVFPSCSGANNRSQTLWNTLRPFADLINLMPPHATRYGFDPYNDRANWHRTTHGHSDDEFISWAGVPKSPKFGWAEFQNFLSMKEVSTKELKMIKNYYDTHYYHPNISPEIRRVYITFAQNAHIHLYRLNQTNADLKNVVVLFFPLEDLIHNPLSIWHTRPRSFKSYDKLSNILKSYLDLSQLKIIEISAIEQQNCK